MNLKSRTARLKLAPQKEPYWEPIMQGVYLGYYRGNKFGTWYARIRIPGKFYMRKRFAHADDVCPENDDSIWGYAKALAYVEALSKPYLLGANDAG